jgi:diketogulonate reductase-like aldo/keto reductase
MSHLNERSTVALRSGNTMPVIGLGTWKLTNDTAGTVQAALRLGYRMIDTAGDYGTQPGIAEAIRNSNVPRENLYIVTKVEENEDSYTAVQNNLQELGLDYADLILIHRPPQDNAGLSLWEGLIRAKQEGLTKDIGVSNYSYQQIDELRESSSETPVVNQIEWSPFGHSNEMLNYCRKNNIIIQAYSPLTRATRDDDATLEGIAEKYDKTSDQVMIRWNLQLGTVPLPKANRIEHLQENLDVFDFELSREEMDILNSLNEHYSALTSLPYIKSAANQEFAFREKLENENSD